MNSFFKRRSTELSPRRGKRGQRPYDENGAPLEQIPGGERPIYTNDERPPFSLRGGDKTEQSEPEGIDHEAPHGGSNGSGAQAQTGQSSSQGSSQGSAEAVNGGQDAGGQQVEGYDLDAGLGDLYNNLYNRLSAYGVTGIPTLNALYGLFESFLRPAIDEAIRQRNRQGETNMAELDADAYSRGMGGSSFLSSMKARERDDIADDVMGLEAKYSATLAEYLYNALTSMQQLEASLYKTALQYGGGSGYSGGSTSGGSHSSSSSSSSASAGAQSGGWGHSKTGSYFDGKWYDGDFSYLEHPARYNEYAAYIESLTPGQVYLLFTSNRREWRMRRWQMQYNLAEVDYNELYSTYFVVPSTGGGGGGGEVNWREMLY